VLGHTLEQLLAKGGIFRDAGTTERMEIKCELPLCIEMRSAR
jgi:hypothetical protein